MNWISVKDKLPDEGKWVLIYYYEGGAKESDPPIIEGVEEAKLAIDREMYPNHPVNVWLSPRGFFGGGEVTHWMPKPDFPKKSKSYENSPVLAEYMKILIERIVKNREKIIEAFIAETGLKPSECEQVIESRVDGTSFYIRKRKKE
ncbi:hypothetical protein LCGC14_2039520 [marine sediment metagenome]|uniref:DUF551 domain-containing protein n=1 Tax=marine sediment metagenome TaxID=412755 RepID=A0A0F9HPD0_9ZZZZ|nr:DUF551 domain-containing protein [Candidatus Scalindua sp.]